MQRLSTVPLHFSYKSSLTGFLTCRHSELCTGLSPWPQLRQMRVVHHELGFPEQLEELGGGPVLYTSCVCLPGVLVLHVRFLDQVPAAGWHLHGASRIQHESLRSRFSGPLYFV